MTLTQQRQADTRPSNRMLYALIAALLAASVSVQATRDARWSPFTPPNPTLWLQSGPAAQKLALGFTNLVADAYWIRAVVYYGGRLQDNRSAASDAVPGNFDLLFPLLDLVTTLDPHFRIAYRFGAIFLTESYPNGPGRPDQAIDLLQRGIERDEGRWEYFHDIGFVYYWWLHDYAKAAQWWVRGASRPGAAEWLKPLAATTLAAGGSRHTSRQLWSELAKSDTEYVRAQAERRLLQLDAMDAIDALLPSVQRFMEQMHRAPRSWSELAQAERLTRPPVDPTGVAFMIDASGRIDLSRQSPLWPLPTDSPSPSGAPK